MSDSHSLFRETPLRSPFTPRNHRYNFNHDSRLTPFQSYPPPQPDDFSDTREDIYGTNICTRKAMANMQKFVLDFEAACEVQGQFVSQKIYRLKLSDLDLFESNKFEVDGRHIKDFDKELYLQFLYFPAEMISCFDDVVRELYEKYFIQPQTDCQTRLNRRRKKNQLITQIKHLDDQDRISLKQFRPCMIGRLIFIRGIVIRSSDIYPQMKTAYFTCTICTHKIMINLQNAKVKQPDFCDVCREKDSFQIQHNLSRFTDKQYIKIQQLPQLVNEGQTPASITVISYDNNVDNFRPGDRVQLIGIYRAYPSKIQKTINRLRSVFSTYIDLISYNILQQSKFKIQTNKIIFSDQQKRLFNKMSQNKNIINDLIKSFAPSIYGHQDIKKGILSQLFGGTKKNKDNYLKGRFRSDINICLLGDPSTSKSQLLQQVYKIAPRSIFTNGRGSSAVGLTANVRKDPQTHQFILQSGALVLSDLGICCIDQFDKMDDNSRTVLLEAMQQQTISIAKAGIVCQLNSRTAILAAANPVNSKYDPRKSVIQNINLPPALLSRFDLIFLMLDIPNQISDKQLASHILDFYSINPAKVNKPSQAYTLHQLARYITYAREYVQPTISQKAAKKLKKEYLDMRALGMSKKTITATPRLLQSLIRISQSFAKMRLSRQVNEDDVQQAIELMLSATLKSATDPNTGIIDFDIIATGRSSGIRKRIDDLAEFVKMMLHANESKYKKSTYLQNFIEQFNRINSSSKLNATRDQFLQVFRLLQSNDILAMFGPNKSNPQFKLQHFVQM